MICFNVIRIMPIFEYTCESCHERSEILIKGKEEPACPKCGSLELHKEFSTFAAHGESGRSSSSTAGHAHGPGCGCCMGPGGCGLN